MYCRPSRYLALTFCALVAASSAAPYEWHVEPGCRWASLPVPGKGRAGFERVGASAAGIDFTNDVSREEAITRLLIADGSGVALGDVDGDGRCDIFLMSLTKPCRLFRNLGGWKFADFTEESGLGPIAGPGWYGKGACFADVNGDGHLDLIVTLYGANPKATSGGLRLFLGDGSGHFRDATEGSGLAGSAGSHSVALADVDGNGTLDLYVANYATGTIRDANIGMAATSPDGTRVSVYRTFDHTGKLVEELRFPLYFDAVTVPMQMRDRFWLDATGAIREVGLPDVLYLNDGKGRFTPVSWTDGAFLDEDGRPLKAPPRDYGLSVAMRDFNGDGQPDIWVCNDFDTPDRVWFGDGAGRFRAAPRLALRTISATSMGVDFGDINRDGHTDILTVDMLSRSHERRKRQMGTMKPTPLALGAIENRPEVMRNTLFLNRGDSTWAEIASLAGLRASEWSWQPVFLDVDLDGYEDVFITNGFDRDTQDSDVAKKMKEASITTVQELIATERTREEIAPPKAAFRNRGDLTFEDRAREWGLDTPGIAHGVAEADLDGDGGLDLVVNMYRAQPALYRNLTGAPRVAVRVRGKMPEWQGIGAKVTLRGGAVPLQSRDIFCGGRYLSGGDQQICFAAGKAERGMILEVVWRSGAKSVVPDVRPNRIYEIDESGAVPPVGPQKFSKLQRPDAP